MVCLYALNRFEKAANNEIAAVVIDFTHLASLQSIFFKLIFHHA